MKEANARNEQKTEMAAMHGSQTHSDFSLAELFLYRMKTWSYTCERVESGLRSSREANELCLHTFTLLFKYFYFYNPTLWETSFKRAYLLLQVCHSAKKREARHLNEQKYICRLI